MAGSCIMDVTWGMCTGLPDILNHNGKWTPILQTFVYSKLQTWRHIHCSHRWINSLSHTLLHCFYINTLNISTVVMLGFWLCQFNAGILVWGLCVSSTGEFFVWLIQCNICSLYSWLVMFVVWVSSAVIFANLRSVVEVRFFVISQCLPFFLVRHFGVSAWRLRCTKHMGCNSDVVQWRIYVRTEDRWAKEIRWEGVSQAVVKMAMNPCVL